MPARDSSDCRARWEHACSRELPSGALGGCSMLSLRGDGSVDPLPCLPTVLGWSGGKRTTMGHKASPCAGQGATAGPAARK